MSARKSVIVTTKSKGSLTEKKRRLSGDKLPELPPEKTDEYAKVATKIQSKWRAVRTDRHVGLIRLIYKEARKQREKHQDESDGEDVSRTMKQVRSEVCKDLMGAVRRCTRMYKTMVFMKKEAEKMAHIRYLRQKLKLGTKLTAGCQGHLKKSRASDAQWAELSSLVEHFDEIDDEKLYVCDKACRQVQKFWCQKRIGILRAKLKALKAMGELTPEQAEEFKRIEEQLDGSLDLQKRLKVFDEWAKSFEHLAQVASAKAAASAVSMMSGEVIEVDENGQPCLRETCEEEAGQAPETADETAGDAAEALAETTDQLGTAAEKAPDSSPCGGVPEDTEGGGSHDENNKEDGIVHRTLLDSADESQKADMEHSDSSVIIKRNTGSMDSLVDIAPCLDDSATNSTGIPDMQSPMQSPRRQSQDHIHQCNISFENKRRNSGKKESLKLRNPPRHLPKQLEEELHLPQDSSHTRAPLVGLSGRGSVPDVAPSDMEVVAGSHPHALQPSPRNKHSLKSVHPHVSQIHHAHSTHSGGFGVRKEPSDAHPDFIGEVSGHAAPLSQHSSMATPQSARVARLEKIEHPSAPSADQLEKTVNSARAPSSHCQLRRHNSRHGPRQQPAKLAPLPSVPALGTAAGPSPKPSMPALGTAAVESGQRFSIEGEGSQRGMQRQLVQQEKQERHSLPGTGPSRPRFNPCAITASSRHNHPPPVTPRLGMRGHGATAGSDEDLCPPVLQKAMPDNHAPPPSQGAQTAKRRTAGRIVIEEKHSLLPPLESLGHGGGPALTPISGAAAAASKSQPLVAPLGASMMAPVKNQLRNTVK